MWLSCEITRYAWPGVGETAVAESQRVRRSAVTEQGSSVRSQQDTAIIELKREIDSHTKDRPRCILLAVSNWYFSCLSTIFNRGILRAVYRTNEKEITTIYDIRLPRQILQITSIFINKAQNIAAG